jgi:hypothetical protein
VPHTSQRVYALVGRSLTLRLIEEEFYHRYNRNLGSSR